MRNSSAKLFILGTLVAGCHYVAPAVPLHGEAADIAQLAGMWDGSYSGTESGRTGSIVFTIMEGSDTARGDVMMTPRDGMTMRAVDAGTLAHDMHAHTPELLVVSFVRVADGMVRGELEPYVAPDCHCAVNTVFRGALTGDRIEGTFTTRGPQGLLQEGKWSAERRKP